MNIDIVEDIIHLGTGGLMAYVGFFQRDNDGLLRSSVVGGLGVVYLLVGVLGFIVPSLFGLLPSEYSIADNLIHLTLGVLGIAVAWLAKGGAGQQRPETAFSARPPTDPESRSRR